MEYKIIVTIIYAISMFIDIIYYDEYKSRFSRFKFVDKSNITEEEKKTIKYKVYVLYETFFRVAFAICATKIIIDIWLDK